MKNILTPSNRNQLSLMILLMIVQISFINTMNIRIKDYPATYQDKKTNSTSVTTITPIETAPAVDKSTNKHIAKMQYLNDTIINLTEENKKLKSDLEDKNAEIKNANNKISVLNSKSGSDSDSEKKGAESDIRDMTLRMTQYHAFFEQLKMQLIREKDLKINLDTKVKNIENSEKLVNEIYTDVKSQFKSNLSNEMSKVVFLEKSNLDLNLRLFKLEKEKEKINTQEKITNNIKENNDIFVLGQDCNNRNSCSLCVNDPSCVWCSLEKKCNHGDITGPSDGSCMISFEYAVCSQ